jgi:hypothetical protein
MRNEAGAIDFLRDQATSRAGRDPDSTIGGKGAAAIFDQLGMWVAACI